MAKSLAERQSNWRRRSLMKSSFFQDMNELRASAIREAFSDDDRPEIRAVIEFFANYPRCHQPPRLINLRNGIWCVYLTRTDRFEAAAAVVALSEVSSLPVIMDDPLAPDNGAIEQVRTEVAEMRRLNMWGR